MKGLEGLHNQKTFSCNLMYHKHAKKEFHRKYTKQSKKWMQGMKIDAKPFKKLKVSVTACTFV